MKYSIISGRFQTGTPQQQAGYVKLFGQDDIEYKFDLYFHWYNLIHEIGHCIIENYGMEMSEVSEEMLVNEFAVGFLTYIGETEMLNRLRNIIESAVRCMPSPVPEGKDFIGYYKYLLETEEGKTELIKKMSEFPDEAAVIYGYFQLRSVLEAFEKDRNFEDILSQAGIKIRSSKLPDIPDSDISADNAHLFLDSALKALWLMGVDVPEIKLQLVDDPTIQCARKDDTKKKTAQFLKKNNIEMRKKLK